MMQINGSGVLAELYERDIALAICRLWDQSLSNGALQAISGPPRGADIARPARIGSFVPDSEVANGNGLPKVGLTRLQKAARGGYSGSTQNGTMDIARIVGVAVGECRMQTKALDYRDGT